MLKIFSALHWRYGTGPNTLRGTLERNHREAHPYVPPHERRTECKSSEGIATGMIDGIISQARVLRRMDTDSPAVQAALHDLRTDADVAWLTSHQNEKADRP